MAGASQKRATVGQFLRHLWNGGRAVAFAGVAVVAVPVFQPIAPGYQGAALSRDGSATYRLSANAGGVTATGNAGIPGGNTRTVFWPNGQGRLAKAQSCATWSAQQGPRVQQGLALRIKQAKNGKVRAITVTKNIFRKDPQVPDTWKFNVHDWRSDRVPAFALVATVDLAKVFAPDRQPLALPWRICARVQGRMLMFQAWRDGQPKPAWANPNHGASVKLPPGTGYAGQTGWYVGHLVAGDSATFTKLYAGAPTASLP